MRFLIANWKMRLSVRQSEKLARGIRRVFRPSVELVVVLCPSFTSLPAAYKILRGSAISLGAQDVFWQKRGAFTGEVSAPDLRELGVKLVIIGHSERRKYLGETDRMIAAKLAAAVRSALTPILCVGETLGERVKGRKNLVIARQLRALGSLAAYRGTLLIAYEPVWAIGTGRVCPPQEAAAAHRFIRGQVKKILPRLPKNRLFVLYGGSVDAGNIRAISAEKEIDGVLAGGASVSLSALEVMAAQLSRRSPAIDQGRA